MISLYYMLSRRDKAILLVIIGAIILFVLIFFLWRTWKYRDQSDSASEEEGRAMDVSAIPLVSNTVEIAKTDGEETVLGSSKQGDLGSELTRVAATFSERFGSFSNESDFENIADLSVLMTQAMAKWTKESNIPALKKQYNSQTEYYGVETRAMSVKVKKMDTEGGKAEFLVVTQRNEVFGAQPSVARYQNIIIRMVKEDVDWKIDYAKWE